MIPSALSGQLQQGLADFLRFSFWSSTPGIREPGGVTRVPGTRPFVDGRRSATRKPELLVLGLSGWDRVVTPHPLQLGPQALVFGFRCLARLQLGPQALAFGLRRLARKPQLKPGI